jgi:FkbM family methyltransferase
MDLESAFAHLDRTYFGPDAYERDEIAQLPSRLFNCRVFIDVGASLGQYTFYANQIMRDGQIYAIEADPDRYAVLERRCAEWVQSGTNNITPVHAAAGDSHEPITFYVTKSQISGGFFPVSERSDHYRPISVEQVTVDDFYEPGAQTFVKIDVEGAELRVMRGATRHLAGGHTSYLTEITWWGDRERGYTSADYLRYLRSNGLQIEKAAGRHNAGYWLTPGGPSGYWRVGPLLVAKSWYGRYFPRRLRLLRERTLNRTRTQKTIGSER